MKSKTHLSLIISSMISIIFTPIVSLAKEIDASPLERLPAVMPEMANHSGHCNATFDVTEEGQPVNINILFCTDNVFFDSSRSSIEKWIYNPKTVNGIATFREGIETRVTYKLTDIDGSLIPESETVDKSKNIFDDEMTRADLAYPWPPYFGKPKKGEESGFCCIGYSVSQIGSPFNVNIESCSQDKLIESANMAIRQWKYKQITFNKKPVSSTGYVGVIHFAKRAHAMIRDPNGYTPLPGEAEDYARYCRAIS